MSISINTKSIPVNMTTMEVSPFCVLGGNFLAGSSWTDSLLADSVLSWILVRLSIWQKLCGHDFQVKATRRKHESMTRIYLLISLISLRHLIPFKGRFFASSLGSCVFLKERSVIMSFYQGMMTSDPLERCQTHPNGIKQVCFHRNSLICFIFLCKHLRMLK